MAARWPGRLAALMLVWCAWTRPVFGQSSPAPEVGAWEQRLQEAVLSRAPDLLDPLLDDAFVYRGMPDIDRREWLSTVRALCWGDRFALDGFAAEQVGDAITATFSLTFFVNPETCRPAVVRALVTDVWVRRGDTWRLLLRHSAPPPASAKGVAAHYGLVPQPPPAWVFGAELSLTATSGNTSVQSVGTGGTMVHRRASSTTRLATSFLSSRSDGELNARVVTAEGRHAVRSNPHLEWFGQAGYTRDAFAGIEHRMTPDGGVAVTLERPQRYSAAIEAAVGYTVETRLQSRDLQFPAARVAIRGAWTGRPGAELTQETDVIGDLADAGNWRATSATTFALTMTRFVSMKLSEVLDYRHAPVPGFRSVDLRSAAAIVLSFDRR